MAAAAAGRRCCAALALRSGHNISLHALSLSAATGARGQGSPTRASRIADHHHQVTASHSHVQIQRAMLKR